MSRADKLEWLKKNERFLVINSKLAREELLTEDEAIFCLAAAILFIKEYEKDRKRSSYLELGYFLILGYTLQSGNFEPLLDLSVNLGFYPISKFILENGLTQTDKFQDYFIENNLENFENKGITETLEQRKYRIQLVKSDARDSCYIAPTSFGKSSMMVELISELESAKIFIIAPTKSLLTQTYKLIKSNFPGRRVIFHDEMYNDEEEFIAIFTQERALRLLKNQEAMIVDALLVDEAHNLFDSSSRSILLGRLIRRVRARKPSARIFYFSPLISNSDNLKFEEQQAIETRRIQFNIKEADIHEYRLDQKTYKYNRFINTFFEIKPEKGMLGYIIEAGKSKNFVYLRAPRKVENFAGILAEYLPPAENKELEQLALTISKNVHEDFYCVELVKKGVLYIHGKMPDIIKEYLEFKFQSIDNLTFIVANSVILEGVNLPIDNLYILNTYSLGTKELINLIGRVNRLNDVFSGKNPNLGKLRPSIHFINSEEFNKARSNMATKIELLKSGTFDDEINNPTLLNFDISKYDHTIENSINSNAVESANKHKITALSIIERENFLTTKPQTDTDRMKFLFLESGLHSSYYDPEIAFNKILVKLEKLHAVLSHEDLDPIEKVYLVFISELGGEISDQSFARLQNEKARNFYRSFIKNTHTLTLKEHINSIVKYFHTYASETGNKIFYIGSSYGEISKEGTYSGAKNYINLSTKSHKELVNLALIKIKLESDFISYKLNEYVSLLKEYRVISEKDYNIFIYGTDSKRNTDLTKLGLSGSIIYKLESDDQIKNIKVDELGYISVNDEFRKYLETQDDLVQFEINKYITI